MKIRSQFTLLIFAIIIIPLVCAVSMPVYHYFTSPQRYLMKGYKELRKLNQFNLSESELNEIRYLLKTVPPNMQIAIYSNYSIIISNIPELQSGSTMSPSDLFNIISESSDKYDYQMQGHYLMTNQSLMGRRFFYICRAPVAEKKVMRKYKYFSTAFLIIIIFEIICIVLIITLSKTIFSSIQLLEVNTQKIADGELDTQMELPKRKQEANEITSLAESLDKMRISLKDNQERRNKFIMGISHDLRTPVALIKGYSEAITDGVVSDMDSIKKSLSIVESKADQLENMINDLINYMKLNTTEWRQHLAQVPIKPILMEFATSATETADVYNRNITSDISIKDGTTIFMDKNLFQRALENIFNNALRYTRDGDTVSIKAYQTENDITILIEDTGIGIEEKDLSHIYDIFYRGTSSRREQGMGIGLSVVKTIIDSHGWNIDVKSQPGEGTTFFITIPLKVS